MSITNFRFSQRPPTRKFLITTRLRRSTRGKWLPAQCFSVTVHIFYTGPFRGSVARFFLIVKCVILIYRLIPERLEAHSESEMSGFSAELIDYLEGRITFEEFDRRRDERQAKVNHGGIHFRVKSYEQTFCACARNKQEVSRRMQPRRVISVNTLAA